MTETLIEALSRVFAGEVFDATDVVGHAQGDQLLTAALEAEITHVRYRSGYSRGLFRTNAIRMWLRRAKRPVVAVTRHNYWSFRIINQ